MHGTMQEAEFQGAYSHHTRRCQLKQRYCPNCRRERNTEWEISHEEKIFHRPQTNMLQRVSTSACVYLAYKPKPLSLGHFQRFLIQTLFAFLFSHDLLYTAC
jgi:hypothetical protein